MSNLILELNNSQNWEAVYSTSSSAVRSSDGNYVSIPEITVPILLEKRIIVVGINSVSAKSTWHFGGYINRKIRTGITDGGNADSTIERKRVSLNELNLIQFSRISANYALSLEVPRWFKDVTLSLWQYIGIEKDSTEELINQLQVDVTTIKNKVNTL
jgi:hypothetical protein